MTIIYNKTIQKERRKQLRNNSTLEEIILWQKIKDKQLGVRFRRQYGIGCYIADFCCPKKKVVIEVDGKIHGYKEQRIYDNERELAIKKIGFKVLRFKNEEIRYNIETVIKEIKNSIA
jgi:very-short-patch-repair endonuclease